MFAMIFVLLNKKNLFVICVNHVLIYTKTKQKIRHNRFSLLIIWHANQKKCFTHYWTSCSYILKVCIHTLYKKKTKNKLACIVWN